MSGNVCTMESKQEIYSSWVQYTTKNEEIHFRRFIKGFVNIWESQLKLGWSNNDDLPDWTSVKEDFGPHLSRLPEELLPAIGKFFFIAKDNCDKGLLGKEGIIEVDLLIRCLTAISRNFDNIPLIASCDFVSHAIDIANTIIHELSTGNYEFMNEGKVFATNLCHFLECLYDPYLTWRHFQQRPPPPLEKLVFHSALLHNEVIPFIYECFETSIVSDCPDVSKEMLSVLGAVVSGAQSALYKESEVSDGKTDNERHNALRGICPATVNLLMSVVALPEVHEDVQRTALKCFTVMVTVLHRFLPHERQIEVITVLEKLREAVSALVTRPWVEETVATLLCIVHTVQAILTATHSLATLQTLMVEACMVDALVSILEQIPENRTKNMELTVSSIRALNRLVIGGFEGKIWMERICGYSRIFAFLRSATNPPKQLLEVLVSMVTEEEDTMCLKDLKLTNPGPLVPFIQWTGELELDSQVWVACTLASVCTSSLHCKDLACKSGVMVALCDLISSPKLDPRAATHLVQLIEALASFSITANELKQIFLLLRTDQERLNPHRSLLLTAILSVTKKAGLQVHCDSYFNIEGEGDGITVTDMHKWNGAVYGFSFHCWVRLEPLNTTSSTPPRRQIFNFVTSQGTGMEGFVSSQGCLVVGVTTKKEFLAATVPDFVLADSQWHCLDLCYMAARRPFGHNQLSVFIDGNQKLAAAIKFPAITEPFSLCTVGSAAARIYQPNQSRIDKSTSGILPSIISQVPNYFSLPLRSSTPLDPNVKNFPAGMQDTIFGPPSSLQGQLGLICLFHEALQQHQVKSLFDSGPNCRLLFSPEDNAEMMVLNSKLVWCFAPAACWDGLCIDLAATNKFSAKARARQCHTHTVKEVINTIGGVQVLFPLLESVEGLGELNLLYPFHQTVTPEWTMSSTALSEEKLEQNPASSMLLLLRNMLHSSSVNQEQLLKNNSVLILGALLAKMQVQFMELSVLKAVELLTEMVKSSGNIVLLRSIHQHLLFNFYIWARCPFFVRISHVQLISTIIKDERKVFRKRYGVQFLLDVIRTHHGVSTEVSEDDNKTIRISLLGIIKFYLQKECNVKEMSALLGFLSTVKQENLVIEVLEMLIAQLESKSCKDQLILLMFEPQAADLIYCLLLNKTLSMDLKHRALKLLSVLLRTEKVYERNKSRLRLQDTTPSGMYPGLISMLQEQQFSMEFTVMLLDQILLTESSSSYSGALSLLQALSQADLEIKLEAARKLLTITFMRRNAPQSLAKQVGWQDCITRLLIKKPITDTCSEVFQDLIVFDEEEELTELDAVTDADRTSPSSTSRISDAAYAIESEIKEVAETVSNAVADNIHYAADNISSAVASAYTVFRQKTVEMQESLEELSARSRLSKRSFSSLRESHEPESPLPLGLDTAEGVIFNRSESSSSTEELSSTSHTTDNTSAKDSVSMTSMPSISSQHQDDDSDDEEKILFDALQRWKAFDAEKLEDKEEELCYLVANLVFTIMWRGIDVNNKNAWKERGQVMTCINLLALNNTLYCSHLELKLRLLEMAVTAALSDLREGSYTADNAAQLIRWIYDLTVLYPSQDHSKKASTKLLDGVLGLLDALLVFQEIPGEEWTEMAKLAFGILLSCAASSNLELCAMATAKLHTLVQTRCMKDAEEGGYLLYYINTIVQQTLQGGNHEHYSFLMPVVKGLIEKLSDLLAIPIHLPDLPQTLSGPTFYEHFQTFCQGDKWALFMEHQVRPLYDSYQAGLSTHLTEAMNTFWAECYEASKSSVHRRNREVGESKLRFQSQIVAGYRARQTEETVRYTNLCSQTRNQELLVRRKWALQRRYFYGPRGAWRARKHEERHWKLSHHENFHRMRLKLCPNLHFTSHSDASHLRDNSGWLSQNRLEEVPLSLNISSVAVRGDTEDADYIPEEDLRNLSEAEVEGVVESGKEKLVLSQECHLVMLMTIVKGRFDITTTHIYFHDLGPFKEDFDRQDFKWPLTSLREIYLRRYNLRRSAIEIFLVDQTNYFLNFTTKTRNRVVSRLLGLRPPNLACNSSRSPADLLRASGLTQKWINHEINNFEYLMQLNTIAGRTYNDLSQYPVFPWIVADYSSEELDLSDPASFRDLSKPIGVVNPKNESEVKLKYDSFEDPSGTIAKFHYGTHYSNSAGVIHYLMRVEPFTSLHIELQSGRFDVADRQFHSIPQTWKLLMNNPNDVKELIPEFFYFPEFLKNLNKFDIGHLQGSRERVDDVILPKWASSAEDFIFKHRKALESEYVSSHLHEWIDLIFGYKQKGAKAVESLNVFYYCSYEGAVDLDAIANPIEREAVEGMINNFGQTPSQLLKEPHPPRLSLQDALLRMLRIDRKPDITLFLNKLSPVSVEVSDDKDPVVFVSGPRSPPKGFLQTVMPDYLVTVTGAGVLGVHSWLPYDKYSNRGFALDIDPTMANIKTRRSIIGSFHPSISLHSQLFCLSQDGKLLFTAGHWDCSLRVFSLTKNKTLVAVIRHFDLVTCVALDQCSWYLVSGSEDCTCVVWDMSQLGSASLKPVQTLYGHDLPVSTVAIATELDMVVSGSKDGTVNIHTIQEGQYLRTLYPSGCEGLATEVTFISISTQGHVAFAANSVSSHSVHVFSINGEALGSKYVAGKVTGLAAAGDCLVVVDDAGDLTMSRLLGLHPVFDFPLHVPIQDVAVSPANTHLLLPLQDGRIVVICVPNS